MTNVTPEEQAEINRFGIWDDEIFAEIVEHIDDEADA